MHKPGPIETFMSDDHTRIDALLAAALLPDGGIDRHVYAFFRHDLLRHIAMEEKVLFPYVRARQSGEPLAIAARLHEDHGLIAKLLVPSPTPQLVEELRALLARHNALEEGASALYATCDGVAGSESPDLVERLRAQPSVPLAPHYDGPPHRR